MHRSALTPLRPWLLALSGTLVVFLWQFATVRANYGGNWTALFCTGALQKQPPLNVSAHVYLFPDSHGFDGQFYRYIAHDPSMRSDLKRYVDDPRLRYRRILVPLLAYLVAAGRQNLIDRAYELVCLLSIGLGIYWSCRIAETAGLTPAWGLLFLAIPAIPITADRLVTDATLAALTAGFVYYSSSSNLGPSWKLLAVLGCAALTRETGILLVLAYGAYLLLRKSFLMCAVLLLSSLPALAWYIYVEQNVTQPSYRASVVPLLTIWRQLGHPAHYPPTVPFQIAVQAADYLALAGVLLGFGFALVSFARLPRDPVRLALIPFTMLGLLVDVTDQWTTVYAFGRYYTPMLVCLSGLAALTRNPWLLLPVALLLPRIVIQLAPQALGIVHWIL